MTSSAVELEAARCVRHCEQSEAAQTKPLLETPSLDRFALLAMTEIAVLILED